MSRAGVISTASTFAMSLRGGISQAEINEIEAHRAKERPTPWSALARRYGRCEADLRAMFEPSSAPEPIRPLEPVASPLSRGLAEVAGLATDPETAAYLQKLSARLAKKSGAIK